MNDIKALRNVEEPRLFKHSNDFGHFLEKKWNKKQLLKSNLISDISIQHSDRLNSAESIFGRTPNVVPSVAYKAVFLVCKLLV